MCAAAKGVVHSVADTPLADLPSTSLLIPGCKSSTARELIAIVPRTGNGHASFL
jgi:hypothetical protein